METKSFRYRQANIVQRLIRAEREHVIRQAWRAPVFQGLTGFTLPNDCRRILSIRRIHVNAAYLDTWYPLRWRSITGVIPFEFQKRFYISIYQLVITYPGLRRQHVASALLIIQA